MRPLVDAQEAVCLCNSVLAISGVKKPISSVTEVRALGANVSLFVAATEVLLERRLEKIHRNPSNAVQRSANCAAVLSALERALGDISLAHIIPSAVVAGDLLHITSMTELIVELARMPQALKQPNCNAQAAGGSINQDLGQTNRKAASTPGNLSAERDPANSSNRQIVDPNKTAAQPAAVVADSSPKLVRHSKQRAVSPAHHLAPATTVATAQTGVQQQQPELPSAAVARYPAVAAAAARQPGSRSASPVLRSGTPSWPGDLADTSNALQGLANYKPKQLQHVMGLANSLLQQQHSGSDVGRSGTPVFGQTPRAGPAAEIAPLPATASAATAAAIDGATRQETKQPDSGRAAAAPWPEESAAEQTLQLLRRANQDIKASKQSAVVSAAAAHRAGVASPLGHHQQDADAVMQQEQARAKALVQDSEHDQQQLLYELDAGETLDTHVDLDHLQGVAQQLAEIRAVEEQLASVERQIQQHRLVLQQQEQLQDAQHAGGILALPGAATDPQSGMSCVITEITSSTDLDGHNMQGCISRGENLSLVSDGRGEKQQQKQPSKSDRLVYRVPNLTSHSRRSYSPMVPIAVHIPSPALHSSQAVDARLFEIADSPDLHLMPEALHNAALLDPADVIGDNAEQDLAADMIAALILESDRDPDCGVDIDEHVAAEVANCIASHALLDHLQEVALELASLQDQQQRQQLQQRKESFRRQSQAEAEQPAAEMPTSAAGVSGVVKPIEFEQRQGDTVDVSGSAVRQQQHQQQEQDAQEESRVLVRHSVAADRHGKIQLSSSSRKQGSKKPRQGSKQSLRADSKRKQQQQQSPGLKRSSYNHQSVQQSPVTPQRLSSNSKGRTARSNRVGEDALHRIHTRGSGPAVGQLALCCSRAQQGSRKVTQQHAQMQHHEQGVSETQRNLLLQLLDSMSSDSSTSGTDPLAAQDSWSDVATGYQTIDAWTDANVHDSPQQQQQQQHEPLDQQQQRGELKAAAAAAKVMNARIQHEIAQQYMLQQQVLKQQSAAARRQQMKDMEQQELSGKQQAYDTKVACLRQEQRKDQQRREKLRKQSQAATEAALEAAEEAAMYDPHHVVPNSTRSSPHKQKHSSHSSKQLALHTQQGAALAAGSSNSDVMAYTSDVLDQLQQLKDDYEKVISVFEHLLVSERRGRVDAERSLEQLVKQMKTDGNCSRRAAKCSVLCR